MNRIESYNWMPRVSAPPRPMHAPIRERFPLGQFDIKPQINVSAPINLGLGSLPLSIGLFAASGASFLIGSQVKNVKGITDIAGIIAAGLGVLNLVAGEFKPAAGPKTQKYGSETGPSAPVRFPVEQQVPNQPMGILRENLELVMNPDQPNTGGDVRNNWQDQDFEFVVRNREGVARSFCAGLVIYDSDQKLVYRTPAGASRKCYTVAGNDVLSDALTAPSFNFWTPQSVTVAVELFRNMNDPAPFMASDFIGIKVSYAG